MKPANWLGGFGAMGVLAAAFLLNVHGETKIKPIAPVHPDRFLTHVSTDKPIYRPGEKVYVRAVMLHANRHTAMAGQNQAMVEVAGPKGDTVASGWSMIQDATAGFAWEIPSGMAGGEYTVKVSHPYTGHSPGVRKFDIRAYRAPRLKSQIVFLRDGYGPGDTVSASVHVDRAEGGVPANAKVTAIARLDGNEIAKIQTKVDEKGNASAQFKLPAEIARGDGVMSFVIEDGGIVETASKTLPILLQTVDLTMYPEGGDLVAGVKNRVYLQAFTPAKKPADLTGVIVDGKGVDVCTFATAHEGRGRFSFTPKAGETYTLRINEPAGIKTTYALPPVRNTGVALAAVDDVTAKGQPVKLIVDSIDGGKFKVILSKHQAEVASSAVEFRPPAERPGEDAGPVAEPHTVTLTPPPDIEGVMVATVIDAKGTPVAERLVFRQSARKLNVSIAADKDRYTPGGAVKLNVTTTDESGKPVAAVVGLSVTDDSVLEMVEKREQAPRLPVMVMLEPDVKELADAHVYLDEANPKAPAAVDLLLGTQGWRRFAFIRSEEFIAKHGDAGRRVLALRVVTEMEKPRSGAAFFGDRAGWAEGAALGALPPLADAPQGRAANEPARVEALAVAAAEDKKDAAQEKQEEVVDRREAKLQRALEQAQQNAQMGLIVAAGKPMDSRQQRQDFVVVREYAHIVRPDRQPNDRVDFAETLYWNAGVKTDEKTGTASVSFATSDAVTAFRVFADAFEGSGALGSASSTIESVQPFYVEVKMPLEVTQGDEILMPITFVNSTSEQFGPTAPQPTGPKGIRFGPIKPYSAPAGQRTRYLQYVGIDDIAGTFDLTIKGSGNNYSDAVTRKLKVAPRGFPIEFARGGLVGPDGAVSYEIEIPAETVTGSVSSELALYPTPLANLTQALEALIQSPGGCFEQTSSTCYPLIMAQQYFISHQGVDPKLIEKSRTLLDEGYARLIGFECRKTRGYEWFGADPGHDALSAYGLLEFTDMALVREVDKGMLARTREFVMNARDGKGGYKRLTHTLHTWIADPECNNAYITWALLECGTPAKEIEKETAWIRENIAKASNTYAIALGANILSMAGDGDTAKAFMNKLAAKQASSGMVEGATTSVIGSGGEALAIETTALATLAWMRDPNYAGNVEKSMKWLCEACKGGRFGSTQSTILALRAIVTYDKLRAHPKAPGTIQVIVDGKNMGGLVAFDEKSTGAIKLQDISEMLSPGKHTIALKMEKGASMPFSIAVRYNTLKPNSATECKVKLATSLRDAKVTEGSLTEAAVKLENLAAETIPTPIAIIGIPGGLEVRHDQLKELVKANKIAAYEVMGRDVVLYWRALRANEKVDLSISLTAAIPGKYTGPASRAYLYYTDEHKAWADGMGVEIGGK